MAGNVCVTLAMIGVAIMAVGFVLHILEAVFDKDDGIGIAISKLGLLLAFVTLILSAVLKLAGRM